jgi:serine/threonine-protein kinase
VVGTLIGQYRIAGIIGAGGMGTVYVGEHTLIGRRAAIKVLLPELSQRRDSVERFFNEARAAAAVNDPGIVQIFDFGFTQDGTAYIVMELLEGTTLGSLLDRDGPLPVVDALRVLEQVAMSMAAAHAAGILHRDLKPDNIFLIRDAAVVSRRRAKVLDFGIAKLGQTFNASMTQVGTVMGTPLYMAPEQFRGTDIDARTDIYSLGCVLFEALIGTPPFDGANTFELGNSHLSALPPPPSIQRPEVPAAVDAVVLHCLEKAPTDRFQSMTELAEAIASVLDASEALVPRREARGSARVLDIGSAPSSPVSRGSGPPIPGPSTPGLPTPGPSMPGLPTPGPPMPGPPTPGPPLPGPPLSGPSTPVSVVAPQAKPFADRPAQTPSALGAQPAAAARGAAQGSGTPEQPAAAMHATSQGSPALEQPRPAPPVVPPQLTALGPSQPHTTRVPSGTTAPSGPRHVAKGSWPVKDKLGAWQGWSELGPDDAAEVEEVEELQGEPENDEFAGAFEAAIPAAFQDLLPYAVEFFRELFRKASRLEDRLIALGAPVIDDLESRAHHVLFLSDVNTDASSPFGQIATQVFRAQVDPFARQLAELAVPPGSVLITVLAAPQLGQGARETIFALRKDRNLIVVPIAAAEIRRACDAGDARVLLVNRIADLHTVSDPFAIYEGSTDPTSWVGFSAEVADLVRHIVAGGRIISVAGPPGAGKTSMVAMAEYGCDTNNVARQFVRIQCGELPNHNPYRLVQEIVARVQRLQGVRAAPAAAPEAAAIAADATGAAIKPAPAEPVDLRATILALAPSAVPGAAPASPMQSRPGSSRPPRRETGLAKRHQLVLVLDDADWLIRLASNAEPDPARREAAREMWRGLAELCATGKHTVIVTSVRDFQVMEQVPLEQPVAVSRVPMRALTRRESDTLVTSLGEMVAFRPTRRAFARLYRESGGNVYALRLICSDIIRSTRERPDYSPLASLVVTPRLIAAAVGRIAATGSSFRTHVSTWLDDVENVVLQYVARERPRSPRKVRRALATAASSPQIAKALDGLELMSLVEHRRGHHRVRIPLFERWINTHLDAPESQQYALKQQRISRIAIGFTCTALLFGGYWTWLRSTRSTQAETVGACRYELDYPDRIGLDETLEIFVYQDCKVTALHKLAVESVFSTLEPPLTAGECPATSPSCMLTVKAAAGKQAHDTYKVRLRVDDNPVASAEIEKDRFAAIRAIGERSVPAISFIPLILALIVSFHKETKKYVAQLFGRGDGTAAGPPPPPGAPEPPTPPSPAAPDPPAS